MKVEITHHAKVRWFERFNQILDRVKIEQDIENNFIIAKPYRYQHNGITIYKNEKAFFVVSSKTNNEKLIITAYPINAENEKLINTPDYIGKQSKEIIDLNESFEIQIYKKVLNGELRQFPPYFWKEDIGGNVFIGAKECTKYLYENILDWNLGEIVNKSSNNDFKKYKLSGMVSVLFENSWHLAIYNAYPEIKPYIIKKRGNIEHYWKDNGIEKAREMGVWLTQELKDKGYKFTTKNILSLRWDRIIKEYKIKSMINIVFNNNLVDFFNTVFETNITDEDIIRYNLNIELEPNRYNRLQM